MRPAPDVISLCRDRSTSSFGRHRRRRGATIGRALARPGPPGRDKPFKRGQASLPDALEMGGQPRPEAPVEMGGEVAVDPHDAPVALLPFEERVLQLSAL